MITLWQLITTVAVGMAIPTIAALLAMVVNNKRIDDVNVGLSKRLDDLAANMIQHRNEIHSDIQMLIGWERER